MACAKNRSGEVNVLKWMYMELLLEPDIEKNKWMDALEEMNLRMLKIIWELYSQKNYNCPQVSSTGVEDYQ